MSQRSAPDNADPSFEELVVEHETWIFRVLLRLCCDQAQAEDLTQETFFRAYRAFPNLPGTGSFKTRLLRLTLAVFRETEQ